MNKFPKTLAALQEVDLEETTDHAASCSAYWAVGDALLEECGLDPTWDEEWGERFKGGTKLREAGDWLAKNGMWRWSVMDLLDFRETARRFPPKTRQMNVTWCFHFQAMTLGEGPKEMAQLSGSLLPGELACVVSDDAEALRKYGPC